MSEPVDMDKAISAAEKVFPPATARLLAARFREVLEVAAIHPALISDAVVESAREVLALAEQAPPAISLEHLVDHLARIRVEGLKPVDGVVSVNAESMADAIAGFLRDNGIEVR